MLGRGALCRPDLPRLIRAQVDGNDIAALSWAEVMPMALHLLDLNLANYDAHYVTNPIKQWLVYLKTYYFEAAVLFERVKRLRDPEDMRRALLEERYAAAA